MRRYLVTGLLAGLVFILPGPAQTTRPPVIIRPPGGGTPAAKFVPKFAVVAETRLLMEGLAHSNYKSIQRLLKSKPADRDTWVFLRGQSLLVAETGNLLLLRPPRNSGRDTWMKMGMGMRDQAAALARAAAAQNYEQSKAELARLTDSCNRCHTTFRVPVRVAPEDAPSPASRDAE